MIVKVNKRKIRNMKYVIMFLCIVVYGSHWLPTIFEMFNLQWQSLFKFLLLENDFRQVTSCAIFKLINIPWLVFYSGLFWLESKSTFR